MTTFPKHFISDFDPAKHLMRIPRVGEYMNVQSRLLWFIHDQRAMIAAGTATCAYEIKTDLVTLDLDRGYAQFKTYIRDVLGNEAVMYGSETQKDFGDYAEKASTKSLGRALLLLGYGTAFANEMDEGDRVVDAPQPTKTEIDATDEQKNQIAQLCVQLKKNQPPMDKLTTAVAQKWIAQLTKLAVTTAATAAQH